MKAAWVAETGTAEGVINSVGSAMTRSVIVSDNPEATSDRRRSLFLEDYGERRVLQLARKLLHHGGADCESQCAPKQSYKLGN